MPESLNLGIDASNIRSGGGVTHLRELLAAQGSSSLKFSKVFLWAGENTLRQLPDPGYLHKIHVPALDKALPYRIYWQQMVLPGELKKHGCGLLFSPGGTAPLRCNIPTVVMSQNLLPFSDEQLRYYPVYSSFRLKMRILRRAQSASMRRANGLIFLTEHAETVIDSHIGGQAGPCEIIPHGIDAGFFSAPQPARPSAEFSPAQPFKILYVSILDNYKHQVEVARAIGLLRNKGVPVQISFVGPCRPSYYSRLRSEMAVLDPEKKYLFYEGEVGYQSLPARYKSADLFLFASSCENLPNILLEAMASGIPVLASSARPMPDLLGEAGIYFDPECPHEIASAVMRAYSDAGLRDKMAGSAFERAGKYSWKTSSDRTFGFLYDIAKGRIEGQKR